jgi:hypothetical protein
MIRQTAGRRTAAYPPTIMDRFLGGIAAKLVKDGVTPRQDAAPGTPCRHCAAPCFKCQEGWGHRYHQCRGHKGWD